MWQIYKKYEVFTGMKKLLQAILDWFSFILGIKVEGSEIIETGTTTNIESGNTEIIVEPTTAETITEDKEEYKMIVLIDNGHASSTPGKRSPKEEGEEQFFEYEFNRDIARRLANKLSELGIKYEILVPEIDDDIALAKRAERANNFCKEYGKENCLFISIHSNAAGNGSKWMTARGWSCYTSKGETASDKYAEIFMKCAEDILVPLGQKIRKYSSNKYSWEDNFTVLVKTNCSAVLSENMFYDNKEDLKFLQSEEGREAITQIHVNAILEIEKSLGV